MQELSRNDSTAEDSLALQEEKNRILLTMEPNAEGKALIFGLQRDVPQVGGNAAQRREYDKRIGRARCHVGVSCPCCNGAIMTMEEIRAEGKAGIGTVLTAVVVEANERKAYRSPTESEVLAASEAGASMRLSFEDIPFGLPDEPVPKGGSGASRAFSVDGFGLDRWFKLFTPRQLLAIATFARHTRTANSAMRSAGYSEEWITAVYGFLAAGLDRLVDRCSAQCQPDPTPTQSGVINTFSRFDYQLSGISLKVFLPPIQVAGIYIV